MLEFMHCSARLIVRLIVRLIAGRGRCGSIAVVFAVALSACGRGSAPPADMPDGPRPAAGVPLLADVRLPPLAGAAGATHGAAGDDADGEGDGPVVIGDNLRRLATAERAALVALEAPPATRHPVVCDILGFGPALYVAHSIDTIDASGARIHRYDPNAAAGERWSLAFDWDREGAEPDFIGGVGGEGITRLRAIGGRIFAADADTPGPGGYQRSDAPYEDYLFVSDAEGKFPALMPGLTPPANTRILPRSFHTFDAIAYRGALVVSGGTGQFPSGPFPGGLWVGGVDDRLVPLRFELGARLGVVRTSFMHRFAGRLYIGFQNNRRRGVRPARFDLAVLSGDPRDPATEAPRLARVTERGGWLTRRFASGQGALYWVASRYRPGTGALFVSTDGQTFDRVKLPGTPGGVQDVATVGEAVYVLTTRAVYRAVYRSAGRGSFRVLIEFAEDERALFSANDLFCSAPLAAYADRLFAGSTTDGRIYEIRAP